MCLFSVRIKNKKYQANKKNGGVIPPKPGYFDKIEYVSVDCGRCIECRKKKARDWQMRLSEEMRSSKMKGYFVTWTFSDEGLQELRGLLKEEDQERVYKYFEDENQMCRIGVRRMMKRWQKKHGNWLRHWIVTEKGQSNTERIHMHGIVWTDEKKEDLDKYWKYGIVDIGKKGVGEASAGYLVKYMSKVDEKHREYRSKVFASKGIGKGYIERRDSKRHKFKGEETVLNWRDRTGSKFPIPKYFREKLWSDEERELLFLQAELKQKKYVFGREIDVSDEEGQRDYERAMDSGRFKNKRLGYSEFKDFDTSRIKKRDKKLKKYEKREVELRDNRGRLAEYRSGQIKS